MNDPTQLKALRAEKSRLLAVIKTSRETIKESRARISESRENLKESREKLERVKGELAVAREAKPKTGD